MPLYRAHKNLQMGNTIIPFGSIVPLHIAASKIRALENANIISRISPPPLAILPGWEQRAATLARIGILDAEQFLEQNDTIIAEALSVTEDVVIKWKQSLLSNFLMPPRGDDCGCI